MFGVNQKILQTLEFAKIRAAVAAYTVSAVGQQLSRQLEPNHDRKTIQQMLMETQDAATILRLKGPIPMPKLVDVQPHLKRLAIGGTLNGVELAQISRVLRATADVDRFLTAVTEEEAVTFQELDQWWQRLTTLPTLTKRLRLSLEDDGHLTDDASPKLRQIRNGIQQLEGQIRSQMNQYTHGKQAQYLSDPIVTIRNERYVIPVKQEYRHHFGGVVHDESASGLTLFIEPQAVMDLNNRLRQRQIEAQQEELRILAELSNELAPYRQEILDNGQILGHFDFVNAKARYAKDLKATEPHLAADNHVQLRQARHPLLAAEKVVANDIELGGDFKAMVITGPNTGGKTITLKTLGLLQLMAQSGLFIPANEGSQVAVYNDIFADIGDEQSIEQNLSTFSGHMSNVVTILNAIESDSLVLVDELGAGTDPQEGAALAIAILDQIGAVGSAVVATTHYPELKAYGYNRPATINASMEFDSETLQPTYRLLIGIPGRSNAFDISRRLGLAANVVAAAESLISADSQDLNNMISDLEQQRHNAEVANQEAQATLAQAQQVHDDLEKGANEFFHEKQHQLDLAASKANEIVGKAKRKSDQIIAELHRLQKAGAGEVKEHQLIAAKTALNGLHQDEPQLSKNKVLRRERAKQALKPGDDVLVTTYGQQGTLIRQMDPKHWEVQVGIIKLKVAAGDLEKTKAAPEKEPKAPRATMHVSNHVNTSLDLRGERYEQALQDVDQYIDAALLAGYPQVTIIHGKGTGALRQGITEYLARNRQVKSFGFAPANAGGNGATVVTFK